MSQVEVYDIFSGVSETDALWREDVAGVENAKERMRQIATEEPGDYFVFDGRNQTIVATLSTGPTELKAKAAS